MPRDSVIENPVMTSSFGQPDRHLRFDEEGITFDDVDGRRRSSCFVPIPSARKRRGQQTFETEWTSDRLGENPTINRVRERVSLWRVGGHQHVTPTTRRLLKYRPDTERQRPFVFCEIKGRRAVSHAAPCHTPTQPSSLGARRSNRLRRVRPTTDGGR